MQSAEISVRKAERMWLAACAHVSDATQRAYAGEVKRFREHLAASDIHGVMAITEEAWLAYLGDLTKVRSTITEKRKSALKTSSALQAARITRAFLRYCWSQRWLDWVPGVGSQRCAPGRPASAFQVPDGLIEFLLNPGDQDDEAEIRVRCAVGLAFWGGFRAREIADLKARDLVPDQQGGATVHPVWREDPVALPFVLVQQLRRYAALRLGRSGPLGEHAALIVRLRSEESVSGAAAWGLLKTWTSRHDTGDAAALTTRAIRDSFKELAGSGARDYIRAIERQVASRQRSSSQGLADSSVAGRRIAADLLARLVGASVTPPVN
ncbi:site-specific integrase [Roseateles puraquae]|uniref:Core-binding (CB) domain-containing protein n=1 Tax=Roseateles puraquae TaxID=431059 RepID=A0A254MXK0_9BURK|nr:site-specific integrase [Roseateles puraquae]MDG0857468.1 site-specific integrase [Roseateles puraquae]OWQ98076.1 hypothetical protein CDO81_26915 [Roseateles puraquae]